MRIVIFTQSLVSCWNQGNAHFLRGIAAELAERRHALRIFEPADGWSRRNLLRDQGSAAVADFERAFPQLRSELYGPDSLDLSRELRGADLVIVHEWNTPELIRRIGDHRAAHGNYRLLFHDTHHRAVTESEPAAAKHLHFYDGVLAYGEALRQLYLERKWTRAAWTFHEAADVRTFRPHESPVKEGDLVWIGNWGDGERAGELREFLIEPVRALGLRCRVYGVRYPAAALKELADAGIEYGGWLANHRVPEIFARYRVTVHIPRRPYAAALHGIPTIRPFEAMACGIPLLSAPWRDSEQLFRQGTDFLMADDGADMTRKLKALLASPDVGRTLSEHGLETIRRRHTCSHRVDELLAIAAGTKAEAA